MSASSNNMGNPRVLRIGGFAIAESSDGPIFVDAEDAELPTHYEGILRSEEEYQRHLFSDGWASDLVFSGPIEEQVLESHPHLLGNLFLYPSEYAYFDASGDVMHPIFARENWILDGFVRDPDLVWKRMEQAIWMAHQFITVPQAAWAFLPLVLGQPAEWEGSGRLLPYDSFADEMSLPEKESFANDAKLVRERFSALAGKVKFTFATFGKMNHWDSDEKVFSRDDTTWHENPGPQVHGAHHAPGERYLSEIFVTGDPSELEACKSSHRIILNGAYAEFLQKDRPDPWNSQTRRKVAQYVRTTFVLGVTLVHELAHALYCQEKHPEICESGIYTHYDEPHMFTDMDEPEIGYSVERRLFGHTWQAIVHPERGAELEVVHTPATWDEGNLVVGRPHVVNYIEPQWCQDYMSQWKWREIRRMRLYGSINCLNFCMFRVHARPKEPSIKDWWTARQDGMEIFSMQDFDLRPGSDTHAGWEVVSLTEDLGACSVDWYPDFYPDGHYQRYQDEVAAVRTLDQEFLDWKVQEAREARRRATSAEEP